MCAQWEQPPIPGGSACLHTVSSNGVGPAQHKAPSIHPARQACSPWQPQVLVASSFLGGSLLGDKVPMTGCTVGRLLQLDSLWPWNPAVNSHSDCHACVSMCCLLTPGQGAQGHRAQGASGCGGNDTATGAGDPAGETHMHLVTGGGLPPAGGALTQLARWVTHRVLRMVSDAGDSGGLLGVVGADAHWRS